MNNFVTIATFTYHHEYVVLKLLLEQKNIRFFFQNETIIGLVPFYSNALGGIFLKVHPEDVERAKKIMDKFGKNPVLKIV
ncbi:MAG TPA: DUF2007 domain-containing protein [Flavobacteriaceae bacterium]|nr:DUF2007 domain-containing protein [Flavobacteriaceae bacterium]